MIVLDASALVGMLLGGPDAVRIAERVAGKGEAVHAPHVIDLEIAHAFRRLTLSGRVEARRAFAALAVHRAVRLERHAHESLLPRIWELRHNLSSYDAAYVALAEALDAPLVTCDERLAAAPGHRARVEVL
ncbi:MAG TPA: type II toxin-antitoxin system VapC family toxin [Longimicrobiales bacterium]|nr:type II toxin-antitoxin system VapC family toxin [Longimicrobiales bacterium]